jgi:hypothetical protein
MTSETSATRSSSTQSRANGGDTGGNGEAVQVAMREVRNAIQGVGRSMPDVARVSRGAVDDVRRAIETGSDQQLTAGVSLSVGMAIGMLLGGAPRILILLALAPVALMGLSLAERRTSRARNTASTT